MKAEYQNHSMAQCDLASTAQPYSHVGYQKHLEILRSKNSDFKIWPRSRKSILDDQWGEWSPLMSVGPDRRPHLLGLKHQYSIRRGHSNPFSHTSGPQWSFHKLNMILDVLILHRTFEQLDLNIMIRILHQPPCKHELKCWNAHQVAQV